MKWVWTSISQPVTKFLGDLKDSNNELFIGNMIDKLNILGCLMNFKVLAQPSFLEYLQCELGAGGKIPLGHKHDGCLLLVTTSRTTNCIVSVKQLYRTFFRREKIRRNKILERKLEEIYSLLYFFDKITAL